MIGMKTGLALILMLTAAIGAVACDDEPAAPARRCPTCAAGEICVQSFDGYCTSGGLFCKAAPASADCSSGECTAECEAALCGRPTQCHLRNHCPGEVAESFKCYGP